MAKLKLSQVPTGSSFIDSNSTYDGKTLEWCVVAHGTDGEGISTLILRTRCLELAYDAKEPLNPDTNKRDYGNTSYEYSNILQFLNSDGRAGEWYTAQHEYDQSPTYPYVDYSNKQYSDKDAFLAHFTDDFKARLRSVTKMGVSRKVHLPAIEELVERSSQIQPYSVTDIVFDTGTLYGTYKFLPIHSTSYSLEGLFRGTHDTRTPYADMDFSNSKLSYITPNRYERNDDKPYNTFGDAFPVIYLDSDSPVEYNTTDQKYYASWNNAPVLTVQEINSWQASAFNIVFKVTDADADTVSTTVKMDDTVIYSNAVTPLGNNITVSTAGIFGNLANGEHEITVVSDDGEKTATFDATFKKVDAVPTMLHSVSENRVFVDRNTTFEGKPIEWIIAAKDIEGEHIVALMAKNPLANYCYDAREVYNPTTTYADNGNPTYRYSNILQWLNSEGAANEWYSDQHEYDYPPNSTDVGGTYALKDGYLHGFSETLKNVMQSITKFGVSKKVHIPSFSELIGSRSCATQGSSIYSITEFDSDTIYPQFNSMRSNYIAYVTRKYPADVPSFIVRAEVTSIGSGKRYIGTLGYSEANSGYSWNTQYGLSYAYPYATNASKPLYTIPVIYLAGDNVPVVYDSETLTYYLDFALSTQYNDYGKHKEGFTIKVKIDCSTPIGDTVIKVYVDDDTIASYTTTISTFNEYVSIALPDSALDDLENGEHTLTIKSDTYGIHGSAKTKYTKVDESVPVILTDSIGHITEPFNMTYQVYDDDGDDLDVTIKLDGTTISTIQDAEQNVDLPLSLTSSQFANLNYGDHSIVIEATDGVNTSTVTLPFTKNSVPTISLDVHELDVQLEPFSVEVTADSADGENITIKAYIDNQEIPV